ARGEVVQRLAQDPHDFADFACIGVMLRGTGQGQERHAHAAEFLAELAGRLGVDVVDQAMEHFGAATRGLGRFDRLFRQAETALLYRAGMVVTEGGHAPAVDELLALRARVWERMGVAIWPA